MPTRWAGWALAVWLLSLVAVPGAALKPNFVLVVADNLGNGDLGCLGSTLQRTPNLDRLAAEGTTFTSF